MSDITFNTKSLRRALRLASTLAAENERLARDLKESRDETADYLRRRSEMIEDRRRLLLQRDQALKERDEAAGASAQKDAEIGRLKAEIEQLTKTCEAWRDEANASRHNVAEILESNGKLIAAKDAEIERLLARIADESGSTDRVVTKETATILRDAGAEWVRLEVEAPQFADRYVVRFSDGTEEIQPFTYEHLHGPTCWNKSLHPRGIVVESWLKTRAYMIQELQEEVDDLKAEIATLKQGDEDE